MNKCQQVYLLKKQEEEEKKKKTVIDSCRAINQWSPFPTEQNDNNQSQSRYICKISTGWILMIMFVLQIYS
mgnify:CR=1 FL=1